MNFANFARSKITPIDHSATTTNLLSGDGQYFTTSLRCVIWLDDFKNDIISAYKNQQAELVTITALAGDVITTMTRGEDGTTALDFNIYGKTYSIMAVSSAGIFASFLTSAPPASTVAAPIMGICTNPTGNATTYYFPSGIATSTAEIDVQIPIERAGTFKNLIIRIYRATANNSDKYTVTIRKNGADTTLLKQTGIANAGENIVSDTIDSFTVVAGDKLSIKVVGDGSGSGVADVLTWTFEFIPT